MAATCDDLDQLRRVLDVLVHGQAESQLPPHLRTLPPGCRWPDVYVRRGATGPFEGPNSWFVKEFLRLNPWLRLGALVFDLEAAGVDQDTFSNVCAGGVGYPAALPTMFGKSGCGHCVCRVDDNDPRAGGAVPSLHARSMRDFASSGTGLFPAFVRALKAAFRARNIVTGRETIDGYRAALSALHPDRHVDVRALFVDWFGRFLTAGDVKKVTKVVIFDVAGKNKLFEILIETPANCATFFATELIGQNAGFRDVTLPLPNGSTVAVATGKMFHQRWSRVSMGWPNLGTILKWDVDVTALIPAVLAAVKSGTPYHGPCLVDLFVAALAQVKGACPPPPSRGPGLDSARWDVIEANVLAGEAALALAAAPAAVAGSPTPNLPPWPLPTHTVGAHGQANVVESFTPLSVARFFMLPFAMSLKLPELCDAGQFLSAGALSTLYFTRRHFFSDLLRGELWKTLVEDFVEVTNASPKRVFDPCVASTRVTVIATAAADAKEKRPGVVFKKEEKGCVPLEWVGSYFSAGRLVNETRQATIAAVLGDAPAVCSWLLAWKAEFEARKSRRAEEVRLANNPRLAVDVPLFLSLPLPA